MPRARFMGEIYLSTIVLNRLRVCSRSHALVLIQAEMTFRECRQPNWAGNFSGAFA